MTNETAFYFALCACLVVLFVGLSLAGGIEMHIQHIQHLLSDSLPMIR